MTGNTVADAMRAYSSGTDAATAARAAAVINAVSGNANLKQQTEEQESKKHYESFCSNLKPSITETIRNCQLI
jgi:hypothetical protein